MGQVVPGLDLDYRLVLDGGGVRRGVTVMSSWGVVCGCWISGIFGLLNDAHRAIFVSFIFVSLLELAAFRVSERRW